MNAILPNKEKARELLDQIIQKSRGDDARNEEMKGAESWMTFHLKALRELINAEDNQKTT